MRPMLRENKKTSSYNNETSVYGEGYSHALDGKHRKHVLPLERNKASTNGFICGSRPLLFISRYIIPISFHKVNRTTGLVMADRGSLRITLTLLSVGLIICLSPILLISLVTGIWRDRVEENRENSKVTAMALVAFGVFNSWEAVISFFTALLKAPQMCAWINLIDEIEDRLELRGNKGFLKATRKSCFFVFAYAGFISLLHLAASFMIDFGAAVYEDLTEAPEFVRPCLVLYVVVTSCVTYPTAAQPLSYVIYTTYLLKNYVRWMSVRVGSVLREAEVHYAVASRRLDSCRLAYARLKAVAGHVSNTWAYSLVITFGGSIPMLCLITYHSIVGQGSLRFKVYFIFHGVVMIFKLLVPMYIASDIEPAIRKLQRTLLGTHMNTAPNLFLSEVIQFERSLNPELDLKCSGCGFFLVDLQSFTAIVGAIITYSLVVVQGTVGS